MQLSAIGTPELLWVAVAAILLFGTRKIPELFRGLGEGMKEFKKATRELADEEATPAPTRRDDSPSSA
jgi:sec-independent protein translocase protein TatA